MHAIILFSHGSTLCGAGENLKHLAKRMEARGDAPIVEVGYLNYSEPAFEDAFATCVERGATHITIAPYFLVAGYFVKVSLPPKIAVMAERFPHVQVKVAEALKQHTLLAEALVACAERSAPPAQWRDLLDLAPQFCRNNPACPLHGTEKCLSGSALSPSPSPTLWERAALNQQVYPRIGAAPVGMLARARQLRQDATSTEKFLWEFLRKSQMHGRKFRRQHPIGSFIADFYCDDARLVIELDGAVHDEPTQQARDKVRESILREYKFEVLRFTNVQVLNEIENVLATIGEYILQNSISQKSSPLPQRGRGAGGEGTSLLVMVHGSPRPESNLDMYAVVEEVKSKNLFPIVEVGFMECNEPSIPTSIDTCVSRGAQRVIAVPYFLHAGTHVADDLPTLLEEAQEKYPGVEFLMGDFIGHDPLLADVLAERVQAI